MIDHHIQSKDRRTSLAKSTITLWQKLKSSLENYLVIQTFLAPKPKTKHMKVKIMGRKKSDVGRKQYEVEHKWRAKG